MADVEQNAGLSHHQDMSPPTNGMSGLAIDAAAASNPTLKSVTDQMHEDIVRQVGNLPMMKSFD